LFPLSLFFFSLLPQHFRANHHHHLDFWAPYSPKVCRSNYTVFSRPFFFSFSSCPSFSFFPFSTPRGLLSFWSTPLFFFFFCGEFLFLFFFAFLNGEGFFLLAVTLRKTCPSVHPRAGARMSFLDSRTPPPVPGPESDLIFDELLWSVCSPHAVFFCFVFCERHLSDFSGAFLLFPLSCVVPLTSFPPLRRHVHLGVSTARC